MPLGLCNTLATFQSMMDYIFYYLLDNEVIVYLNDIRIYTESVDKYIPLVQEVLSRLDKAHLGVNLNKCSFQIEKVEFLGYIISEQVIEICEKIIEEVRNWAVPRKVQDV